MAEPFQLPPFPDQASLTRRRPARHEGRFYRIAVWPDLFGRALLARQWGHIGSPARLRLDRAPAPEGNAQATSRTAPKPAARAEPPAKRAASAPRVPTLQRPLAATLPAADVARKAPPTDLPHPCVDH
jgi:predicted DNA-binding WGR domain protein